LSAAFGALDCIHMSGLFDAVTLDRGQDGFRDVGSNQPRELFRPTGSHGVSHVPDRVIPKPPATRLAIALSALRRSGRAADLV
jgi:hypothetical protein